MVQLSVLLGQILRKVPGIKLTAGSFKQFTGFIEVGKTVDMIFQPLLDLSHTIAAELFEGKQYPWQVLKEIKAKALKRVKKEIKMLMF